MRSSDLANLIRRKDFGIVWLIFVLGISLLNSVAFAHPQIQSFGPAVISNQQPFLRAAGLGRGVNFGNMLEAPNEGDWGLFVQENFFDRVAEAEFEHIRLPVSWTHHAQPSSPYIIESEFMDRVEWAVLQANMRGIKIILNVHHYDELNEDPVAETPRALSIWSQIANRFQAYPDDLLVFEILNEPHGQFNEQPQLWNEFMETALNLIRTTNPTRKVLVGPVFWNSIRGLDLLEPPIDSNLIASVHFYEPFAFTHQGATWVDPVPPVGVAWNGNQYGIANPFQNWSWGTTLNFGSNGVEVNYEQGWAGLQFHNPVGFEGATELTFDVDRAMQLFIKASNISSGMEDSFVVQTSPGTNSYSVDISDFGSANSITNIILQNGSPAPQPSFLLSRIEITDGRRVRLISTEEQAVRESFQTAVRWSYANRIPLHLGEFGSFSPADANSRIRWTTAVRSVADFYRIDWAYWEFGAGFGIYDPNDEVWRLELLRSLIPGFTP